MSRSTSGNVLTRFILVLFLVCVVVVGGFGFYLHTCAVEVGSHFQNAKTAYDACTTQIEAQDYDAALKSIRTTSEEIAVAKHGLEGWQWDIAAKLPILSQDVTCAREAADISDSLANDAMMPVIELAEDIVNASASEDPFSALGQLPNLLDTITYARSVVGECKTRADALGTSHFDGVNELVTTVQAVSNKAEDTFTSFDPLLNAINGISGIAQSITDMFTPTETTDTVAT